MQVFVRIDASTKTYTVEPTDTIFSFKQKIREKSQIPIAKMILRCGGKSSFDDNLTLADYNVTKESTFYLTINISGSSYCEGCIFPALICLSAHVSLQCGENFSLDYAKLLHSIKTKLNNLDGSAMKIIINCIQTCGHEWNYIEIDDANYFKNHAKRRKADAINSFIGTICRMINPYLSKYRKVNMIEEIQDSLSSKIYDLPSLVSPVDIDWLSFLHETRCPICFCRFHTTSPSTNSSNKIPMTICRISEKHVVCHDCSKTLRLCPLCNGTIVEDIRISQSTIDAIKAAQKNLETYCFPSYLEKEVQIGSTQQPIANGATGKIFRVKDKYAVKCPISATVIDTEEPLIHEIAASRPLGHILNLVTVYGGVRSSQYGIGIVMEYVNGPSLATALSDNSGIIRNLSMKQRLHIALGIAQGIGELHLAKLVHRDLKPENILLSQSTDGTYIPKIADFGVSFQIAIASATHVKESGGTVGYDAPEVVNDGETPSTSSDIYALGFILYEILTGKRLFVGLKSTQIIAKYTMRGERPNDWTNDIPTRLRQTIERAWSMKPKQRTSIGEIIHSIRNALNENQLTCLGMLNEVNETRKQIASVELEDFNPFELFVLDEFVKRMTIDDCEVMKMFINGL